MPFNCYGEDVVFAHHFMATHPLPHHPTCRHGSVIGYTSKNYLKWWVIQLAIHPVASCGKDRLYK